MSLSEFVFGREVVAVARSLRDDPDKWGKSRSGHELIHNSGVVVWIGSARYALRISVGSVQRWGGVTMLSAFGLSPGHHFLWRAVKRWERAVDKDVTGLLGISA